MRFGFKHALLAAATGILAVSCVVSQEAIDGEEGAALDSAVTIEPGAVYTIVGVQSNKCVEIRGGSTAGSAAAQIAACNGTTRQQFRAEPTDSGNYRLKNVNSGLCLGTNGGSTADGATIVQSTCGTAASQQFSFTDVATGVQRITVRGGGKALDVMGRATADGTGLQQWSWANGDNQKFSLRTVGGSSTTSSTTSTSSSSSSTTSSTTSSSTSGAGGGAGGAGGAGGSGGAGGAGGSGGAGGGGSTTGAQYYVATNGSDSNPGTLDRPFKTISKGVNAANAGDTVYIRGGTYTGWSNGIHPTKSGTQAAWITFRAYPGELPILDGGGSDGSGFEPVSTAVRYIRVMGIAARNYTSSGFANGWNNPSSNIELKYTIAENNGINGIAFYKATGVRIENSIIAHNGNKLPSWSSGVNLFQVGGTAQDNVVHGNVSFENIDISSNRSDGSGFILDENSTGATFENNIGFRNGGSCIRITRSPNAVIANNTCFGNGIDPNVQYHHEIFFSDAGSRTGAVVRNNVAVASSGNQALFGATGVTQSNNLLLNGGAAAPFFTSTSGALDFHAADGATQLIDAGTSASAPSDDIGFDPRCLKQQSGQAVSWWQYAPDYTYIASVGGIEGCFRPVARPQGSAADIGAYERPSGG